MLRKIWKRFFGEVANMEDSKSMSTYTGREAECAGDAVGGRRSGAKWMIGGVREVKKMAHERCFWLPHLEFSDGFRITHFYKNEFGK